jgi:hypothetical protein
MDLKDKRFMMASDQVGGSEGMAGARTELKSPIFKGNEHPLECFSFWFYFGVSCNYIKMPFKQGPLFL